jgi:hypothetical protein
MAVTVRVAMPLAPLNDVLIFAVPTATPVARPGALCPEDWTEAVAVFEDVHVAVAVTSLLVPSL